MTIPEIFDKHGEPYFRAAERAIVADQLSAEGGPRGRRARRRDIGPLADVMNGQPTQRPA